MLQIIYFKLTIQELRMETSKLILFSQRASPEFNQRKTLLIHLEGLNKKMISQKMIKSKLQPKEVMLSLILPRNNKRKLIS
jgi:hypothetical protein